MAVKLRAEKREDLRKSNTKQIRQAGFIPAIVYGNDKEPKTVSVSSIELLKTVRDEGRNAIIALEVDGQPVDVMLHDYQVDPLKDELLHADFYVVNMSREMDVDVAIHLEGEAQGAKDGGVLQQPLHDLAVRAKPADIPEHISVDISKLDIGDSITVADLKGSNLYEILADDETVIVSILPPQAEAKEEEADSEEGNEAETGQENEEAAEGTEDNQ
ncbi:50S ribosomal protein L25/general stress protein Ctc [Aquibacillus salsiterrae]|uniref:Large ribosomal subunit protein bL25 n=1 Tax=Aquibacillus salsiterrae TaxID=2950439 RepID=A0A9X3WFX8_9BACI|nr:50S ribosomal protein L25/general stress protein Ctc [Aquibacillus salsiterrae]MDC3417933.1 50S ribosomal protein L25/general stress protein Ctc [Aquibacillus salsiterrae]